LAFFLWGILCATLYLIIISFIEGEILGIETIVTTYIAFMIGGAVWGVLMWFVIKNKVNKG